MGRKDYSANPYRYYQNHLRALGLSNLELMAFVETEIAFSEPLIARYLSEYKKSKASYTLSGFRYDRINYLICRSNLIQRLRSLDVFVAELKRNGLQSSLAFHRSSIAALGIRMTGIR